MRKRIGMIGMGFVGRRLAEILSSKSDLVTYDKQEGAYPEAELASCDFAMICVDTPSGPDGAVDLRNVEEAVRAVPCDKILIRSTVPPGTTARLARTCNKAICFAPEYVGESLFLASDWSDQGQPFFILGGEADHRKLFVDDIEYLFGPQLRIMQMESGEAELVKYMENSYFALKVSFVNEFRALAEHLKLDWHTVREGWLLDPRIERDHTSAFREAPGYGGKCLPKDVRGIVKFAEEHAVPMQIMKTVRDYNDALQAR